MGKFSGKSILFFCPAFFGYDQEIAAKMRAMGAQVDAYDERPKNNFITKASIRINKRLVGKAIKDYYNGILAACRGKRYDYIFVANIEAMLPAVLEQLKQAHPEAIFILYMWDSLQNKKQTPEILPYFDRVYSFDPSDLQKIKGVRFRPLFFIDQYAAMASHAGQGGNTLSFIGTVHSDRYQFVNEIKEQAEKLKLDTSFFMYFPSPIMFAYKKLIDRKFYKASFREFSFQSLPQAAIIERISKACAVLDVQHPKQTGLTMRTLEMLGAQKKLITTNPAIKEYDFYRPENIYLIDRHRPVLDPDFFEVPYQPIADELYFKYSLEGWLCEIFEL